VWQAPEENDASIASNYIIAADVGSNSPAPVPESHMPHLEIRPGSVVVSAAGGRHPALDSLSGEWSYSASEERERSKDRLKSLDIPPLPLAIKDLHQWVQNLPCLLSGQHWCCDQIHACDLTETTPEMISLSHNFLTVIMRSATAHKVGTVQRAAQSLLQEEVLGINGLDLIKAGKGFELFHSRVKTGFSRGLGTETYEALWEFVHSMQHSGETVGAYFERLKQLYGQVQLTKGCEFGEMSRKTLALKGLENGAYHECLPPWVKKVLAGQNKMKIESATMEDIQSSATNLLVTSRYYQDNTIQAGRLPAKARAASDSASPPPLRSPPAESDSMLESIFNRIR
jgi:hypothetical protein